MCGNGIGHQTWQRIMFNLARPWPAARTPKSSCHQFAYITLSVDFNFRNSVLWNRAAKSIFGPQGKRKLAPPPRKEFGGCGVHVLRFHPVHIGGKIIQYLMPTAYKINQSKIDIHYLMPTVYKINHSKIDIQYLMPTIYKINQNKIDIQYLMPNVYKINLLLCFILYKVCIRYCISILLWFILYTMGIR
jgi:hypothetical protein